MKAIERLLKEGLGKKECFDKLVSEGKAPKDIAKKLSMIPDAAQQTKYNSHIIVLIVMILGTWFLNLLGAYIEFGYNPAMFLMLFPLALDLAISYMIYKKQPFGFFLLLIFVLRGIFMAAANSNLSPEELLVGLIPGLAIFILAIYLKIRLFPYQSFIHTKKDGDGIPVFTAES